jgi:hypothetical protein
MIEKHRTGWYNGNTVVLYSGSSRQSLGQENGYPHEFYHSLQVNPGTLPRSDNYCSFQILSNTSAILLFDALHSEILTDSIKI